MAATILQSLYGSLTPDVIGHIGSTLGESPGNLQKGMSATLPVLLAGITSQIGDPGMLRRLFNLITDRNIASSNVLRDPSSALSPDGHVAPPLNDLGGQLLSNVFGGRSGGLANAIANFAGIKSSSGSSLLSLGAPLVMAYLGDRTRRDGLGASGLASLLAGERGAIASAVPPGLAGVLPDASPKATAREAREAMPAVGGRRWWPLVLATLALLALWGLLRGARETFRPAALAPMASERVGNFVDLALPSGTQLHVPSSGVEMLLIGFLQDPSRGVDQNVWFNFDRLLFDTGSARLQPQSREQLRNVADVLKAYPSATLKIGGYTDDQGDAAANQALSTARATVVKNELVGLGIAPDRLVAEGYGAANPVADNATEQGRAQNRRIALQVTRK